MELDTEIGVQRRGTGRIPLRRDAVDALGFYRPFHCDLLNVSYLSGADVLVSRSDRQCLVGTCLASAAKAFV
jgi:hypothetical protein